MLRRRRMWVGAAAAAVLVVGGVTVAALRPVYRAQVVLRVLEMQPAKEYVAPTVTEQYGERLKTLRLALMARPLLLGVADELDLPRALHLSRDAVVEAMRSRMEVKVEGDDTFLLTYEDSDATRARTVADRVAAQFVNKTIDQRLQAARGTREALVEELERLRPELARRERALREYKMAHYGSLPEQQEENLRTLDQTTMEINIQATNLDTAEERRRQLLLGAASALRAQEGQLSTALHDARTRYTEEHFEVKRIAAELDRVHEQRVAEDQVLRAGAENNPELSGLAREIAKGRALLDGMRKRQTELRQRLAATAEAGNGLAPLVTDLEAVRAKYTAAISKLHEAELAEGVEKHLRGLRWDTVEAAAPPLHPVRPDRAFLALLVVLLAGAAGLGAGFTRDFADTSIHAPEELVAAARDGVVGRPLEVLACIPRIDSQSTDLAARRDLQARFGNRGPSPLTPTKAGR